MSSKLVECPNCLKKVKELTYCNPKSGDGKFCHFCVLGALSLDLEELSSYINEVWLEARKLAEKDEPA
jgi:hypothetical protein